MTMQQDMETLFACSTRETHVKNRGKGHPRAKYIYVHCLQAGCWRSMSTTMYAIKKHNRTCFFVKCLPRPGRPAPRGDAPSASPARPRRPPERKPSATGTAAAPPDRIVGIKRAQRTRRRGGPERAGAQRTVTANGDTPPRKATMRRGQETRAGRGAV